MVDFEKLLGKTEIGKIIDPIDIFNELDRESGKEQIRPAQKSVLNHWHCNLRDQKDLIVKLHTGQGKTLIGLLMLQSSLNEGKGPALYLCPNNYLVSQTIEEAKSFGIETIQFEDTRPPQKFLNSGAILVANCKKLFNGKSVFGVVGSRDPIHIGALVMDDAHKCLDIMREAFSIVVKREDSEGKKNLLYNELIGLFEESLERQARGTYLDIKNHGRGSIMTVPFWTWHDRQEEVLNVLSTHKEADEVKFVWDLLKNKMGDCWCIISGKRLEITPRLLPLELIPSFSQTQRRIFLSATLTEDAFLVKDLGIEPKSVSIPLNSGDVKYCGERLILIPTLVDTSLSRDNIILWLSNFAAKHGNFGVVSLVPSTYRAKDWEKKGATLTSVRNLGKTINELKIKIKNENAKHVLVLLNEYDGVDLPDGTCRILCLDTLPSYMSLIDQYSQQMRPYSREKRRQQAQRVEQGIGRAIRGSRDWCIVIITGTDLTDFLSEDSKRKFLSHEAQIQINIGKELATEMKAEGGHLEVIEKLINQCLERDAGWKKYYKKKMADVIIEKPSGMYLDRAVKEREAELLYQQGHHKKAFEIMQTIIASSKGPDKGWFLQLLAIYQYPVDRSKAMEVQLKAHTENSILFRPLEGISYSKMLPTGVNRASQVLDFIKQHDDHNALFVDITNKLDKLTFGGPSDLFEKGIYDLGTILGFTTQRPEKLSGVGPDNLWQVAPKKYWIIECKNEKSKGTDRISKDDEGQLGVSIAWFHENYDECTGIPIMIHPAKAHAKDAYVNEEFWVLQPDALEDLKKDIMSFINSLKEVPVEDITKHIVKKKLAESHLDTDEIKNRHLRIVKERKLRK